MKKNKEKTLKKPKQKISTVDIIYKVLTAAMAVAMFPICYFASLVHVEIAHPPLLNSLLGLFTGCDPQQVSSTTYESISIKKLLEFIDLVKSFATNQNEPFNIWSLEHFRPAIIAAGFLALALLIGLVILVVVFFVKNEKVIMALSATGFALTVVSAAIFTQGFANPITSGEVSIAELFNIGGLLTNTILSFVGDIAALHLDIGFYSIMFLMLGIFAWSISIYVVNLEDRQKQKQKQMQKKSTKK